MKKLLIIFVFLSIITKAQNIKLLSDEIVVSKDVKLYNKVVFGVINSTENKLLFYDSTRDFRFSDVDFDSVNYEPNINDIEYDLSPRLIIKDSNNNIIEDMFCPADLDFVFHNKMDTMNFNKNELFKNFIEKRLIIIEPNETFYFVRYLSLPNLTGKNNDLQECFPLEKNENYTFHIEISQSREYLLKIFPKEYINKLQKEKIEIFNGKIISTQGIIKWLSD